MAITLRPSRAPNIPIAPVEYDQRYQDQLSNTLRLYFTQVDNFTGFLAQPISGTTAERPVLQVYIGQMFFDTDLGTTGLPIWWDGTQWINASGTAV